MKKFLMLLLAFLLIISMAACDSKKSNDDDNDNDTEETSSKNENSGKTAENTVILSNEYADIKYLGMEEQENRFVIKFSVTGKYTKSKLYVSSDYCAVNGIMFGDPVCSTDDYLEAGETGDMNWYLSKQDLNKSHYNITTLSNAKIAFYMFTSGYTRLCDAEPVSLVFAPDYAQEYNNNGEVLYDQNDLIIISQCSYETGWAKFFITNNSDKDITIYTDEEYINGYSVSITSDIIKIFANSSNVVAIQPWSIDKQNYNIDKITSIKFKAEVKSAGETLFEIENIEATYDTFIDPTA